MGMRHLLLLCLLGACLPAMAQSQTGPSRLSTTPLLSRQAEPALGKELRASVSQATQRNLNGEHAKALDTLHEVALQCDAYRSAPGRQVLSFRTQRQYELYLRESGNGEPVDWLDMACANAYTQLGYIAVEKKDIEQALRWLDKAHATAPYEAEPLTERGAALIQRKDWAAALDGYQRALALTRTHPEAAYAEALALRGTGFAQIELGDLAAAQAAYEKSLELEPDNKIANNELTYIKQLRERQEATP